MRVFSALFQSIWSIFPNLLLFFLLFLGSAQNTLMYAAENPSFSIANYLPIIDSNVSEGDIISFSPKGYYKSKTPYDSVIVGVVTEHPAVALEIKGPKKSYAVVTSSNTFVKVSTSNGTIKKGDPITTSSVAGVGMKATRSGYIIGAALEDFVSNNPHEVRKISVTLNIHYHVAQSSIKIGLLDVLNLSTLATYEEPLQVVRYVTAAGILLLSFVIGFYLFAKTANKGIEALGRNPLASRMIQLGILMNVMITVSIVLAGLLVAFFVIRF